VAKKRHLPKIAVWVNEDETGDAVGLFLDDPAMIEIDGELYPAVELSPARAMQMAEVLVACAGEIIKAIQED
jgi:hypothetical protein